MTEKINQIFETLKELTLLEASELINKIEQTFKIDATASTSTRLETNESPTAEIQTEEKKEFDVILEIVPQDKKIAILKVVRSLTGLGLKEVKELVESAPKHIQKNLTKEAAEESRNKIEAAGGKASLS